MRNIILDAPVESGQFMSLKDCGEASFVNGTMGRGVAVKNTNGRIISPFSGRVLTVYRNAISIVSTNGINLFIQVGDSAFYEECVKENQQIGAYQILAYFNSNKIVMFTVKNHLEFGDITFQLGGQNYTINPQSVSNTRKNNSKENDEMAEETQIRKVATKCSFNINPRLTELKKEAKRFPPIVIIVTKYDMCMHDTDEDEIKEIIQHEKVFGGLFKKDTFIAAIPVSLGDTLMDDSYSGDLDPINISLPILLGVNFALIDLLYEGKALIEEHQKLKEENQKELNWARNQKRIEDNRWGITRWLFGGYDPDQLQQGIYEVEKDIHEIEKSIKEIREIAGYFKQSSQRINRELEAVNMIFVNGAWQNANGRRRFWNEAQSVANYF